MDNSSKTIMKLNLDPSKKEDVDLVRLMAAVNDLKTANTFLVDKFLNGSSNFNVAAERFYLFRLACGHLHEALSIYVEFKKHSEVKKIFSNADAVIHKQLNTIEGALPDVSSKDTLYNKIRNIRNDAAFHYKEKPFTENLAKVAYHDDGYIISVSETHKDTRYLVADNVFAIIFESIIGNNQQEFQDLVKTLGDLQIALTTIIDWFTAARMKLI